MKPKNNILQYLGFIVLAFASNPAHATPINWAGTTNGLWSAVPEPTTALSGLLCRRREN